MKKLSFLLIAALVVGCGGGAKTNGSGLPPLVTTTAPSSITSNSAILNGTVIPNGQQTQSWFEYGTDSVLTTYVSSSKQDAGSGLTSQGASMTWNGLQAGTTYYFRFCAENSTGTSKGQTVSFTTSSSGGPPTVSTLSATFIGTTDATLNGNVTPNGSETTAWFEWGTDPSMTIFNNTTSQSVGSGMTSQQVNAALTGLSTGTRYYFRVAARNSVGTVKGNIVTVLAGGGNYYHTDFNLTENPISEGGNWINGRAVGLDWYDVITSGGIAYGDYSPSIPKYTDPTAILTGSWGPNQTVEATVYSINQNESYYQEVELRLRTSITAHSITGYEVLFRCLKTSAAYASIGRWNGPLGDFTDVTDSAHFGSQYGVQDGDVVKATVTGTNPVIVRAYINNVLIMTATDSSPYRIQTGNPGVGFDFGVGNTNTDFGFKNFTATDN